VNNAMPAVTRPLTVLSGNLDGSAIAQRVQEPGQLLRHALMSGVVGGESNLNSSATSGAKSFLQGVKESPDGFPPLKSVAESLCFILDNCEVLFPTSHLICNVYDFQTTEVNKNAIELLAPRVKLLSRSLCAPIPPGDINEEERGSELER